jgi:hypothetical protein
MSEENLKEFLNSNLSIRQISKLSGSSYSTVRYWLKKYGLSPVYKQFNIVEYGKERYCPRCKCNKDVTEFYKRRKKLHSSSYCRSCSSDKTFERMRKFKEKCVEYKGGSCKNCGYKRCFSALEFHHVNPEHKDFTISHMRKYSFDEITMYELDKCVLLCSNCHREVESGVLFLH